MKRLILRNSLSPGDIVLLSAAVRDLHLSYPGKFLTDVRTSCEELWEHNPYLTHLEEGARGVEVIDCHYPLINQCNQAGCHSLHGFIEFLNDYLDLSIRLSRFHGDIHLSAREKSWMSQVHEEKTSHSGLWRPEASTTSPSNGGHRNDTSKWLIISAIAFNSFRSASRATTIRPCPE